MLGEETKQRISSSIPNEYDDYRLEIYNTYELRHCKYFGDQDIPKFHRVVKNTSL